ncbi:unnamed protein product, partial [Durusdinium trenchii]
DVSHSNCRRAKRGTQEIFKMMQVSPVKSAVKPCLPCEDEEEECMMKIGHVEKPVKPDAFLFDEDDMDFDAFSTRAPSIEDEEPLFPSKLPADRQSEVSTCTGSGSTVGWAAMEEEEWKPNPKRALWKQQEDEALEEFLHKFKFEKGLNHPQSRRRFSKDEQIYPIHVAARIGRHQLVRLMVQRGADPQQKSSKGRKPIDFAWERADLAGEGRLIIEFLKSKTPILPMRDFFEMMQQ